jgi:hypothetical protein
MKCLLQEDRDIRLSRVRIPRGHLCTCGAASDEESVEARFFLTKDAKSAALWLWDGVYAPPLIRALKNEE